MQRQNIVTGLLVSLVTAATYLVMHFFVEPHLPVVDAEVPALSGLSPEQARAILAPRGLLLSIDGEREDDHLAAGSLTEEKPLPGSRLRRGAEVHALVVIVPPPPTVPTVAGLPLAEARQALERAHLVAGLVTPAPDDTVAAGVVVASSPGAGTSVKRDVQVDLMVSSGKDAAPVPSVVGKHLSKAKEALEAAGFSVGGTHLGSNDNYDQGVVIRQTPASGASAARGSKIDLVIND